ncbi:WD40-repeat-containing domain protein [Colletotrichum lupini]|nr:WD40-repeat-containing domain protein [Colletotrichum lupini]
MVQNRNPNSIEQGLSAFLDDANRFLLYHRVVIENTPLQLYASALLFSPKQSIVKEQFRDEAPDWVTITPGLEATWNACLQTLEGDTNYPCGSTSVAFSADGKSFVSCLFDGVVKVWDRVTGRCTHQLEPHSSDADAMTISSDGSTVALYVRGRIVIRSTKGIFPTRTIECHPEQGEVDSIALNANGQWIALGSTNHLS